MSENNSLSIEEIIKRAERIKAEADRQLENAEHSLSEKAKAPRDEVVVDEEEVKRRVAEAVRETEIEDDVKQYVPPKKEEIKVFSPKKKEAPPEEEDADIKLVEEPFYEEETESKPVTQRADSKTRNVVIGKIDADGPAEEKAPRADERTRTAIFVTSEPKEDNTDDDLENIPTIVSKEGLVSAFTAENDEEETGVQMTFAGFEDLTDEVEKIDEEAAERELEERRREKVGKFRLFGPDETDNSLGNNIVVDDDYDDDNEKDSFIEKLLLEKKAARIRVLATGIVGVILIALTALKDSSAIPSALSSHSVFYPLAIILYIIAMVININVFVHGFNFKKKINFDLPVSIGAIVILLHSLALLRSGALRIDGGVLLAGAGTFALCMSQIGKLKMMSRIVDNFSFITSPGAKYTLENITNGVDAEIISRGMLDEEPRLKMSVKTDFPSNFLEISCKSEPADKLSVRIFIADAILSVILFFVIGKLQDFNTALNVAVCAMTISLPCASLMLTNSQLCDISSQLKYYGSRVCGFEGAAMACDANAVVMESADLFGKESCGLHGIKTFHKAKVDDAIINAAAVIVQTNSPLKHVFDDVIIGQQSILPPVEGVIYEETMGTSAWIYDKKVLVGTRELLRTHGVKAPKQSFEAKYTYKGRKALYLAVDGEIIAMFIVSYSADPTLRRELKKLEKNDLVLIVKSADPYITEESLIELFRLPAGFIRVMNYSSTRAYDKYSSLEVEKSPAYVVHGGTSLGLIGAMRGAEIIVGSRGIISFLCTFGCLFGFAAIALLAGFGLSARISNFGIIAFQSIWAAFMYIVIKLKGLGL